MVTRLKSVLSHASRLWSVLMIGESILVHGETGIAEEVDEIARLKDQVIQLQDQSKWVQAMPLAERLVAVTKKQHGEDSTNTAEALHLWAWLVQQNGNYDKAEQFW